MRVQVSRGNLVPTFQHASRIAKRRDHMQKNDFRMKSPRQPRGSLVSGPDTEAYGGEGGIRTPGSALRHYDGLANRCFRPLSHLSGVWAGLHTDGSTGCYFFSKAATYRLHLTAAAGGALDHWAGEIELTAIIWSCISPLTTT